MQKELEKLHRHFQTQYLLFPLCTFPFNVKMSHLKKKKFLLVFLKLQYWFLPYQSRGISCFATPILQGCSFKSLPVVWYLTVSSKWGQHFPRFVSIHAPISCNFSSFHSRFFWIFLLFSSQHAVQNSSTVLLFCILLFYKALLPHDIFYKTLVNILSMMHTL